MKKLYFLTVALIIVITAGFLIFSGDIGTINTKFLSAFGIIIDPSPVSCEKIKIPLKFDSIYENYNLLQIESGLDLSPYKGKNAERYTYKVLNFPKSGTEDVFVNVICVKSRPVAGDIMNPAIDGFMQPLCYMSDLHR